MKEYEKYINDAIECYQELNEAYNMQLEEDICGLSDALAECFYDAFTSFTCQKDVEDLFFGRQEEFSDIKGAHTENFYNTLCDAAFSHLKTMTEEQILKLTHFSMKNIIDIGDACWQYGSSPTPEREADKNYEFWMSVNEIFEQSKEDLDR